jgi:hypothetical protein
MADVSGPRVGDMLENGKSYGRISAVVDRKDEIGLSGSCFKTDNSRSRDQASNNVS